MLGLDYGKRRNLFIFGIIVMAMNLMVWTRDWLSEFMNIQLIGEIDVATAVGVSMMIAAYLFYKRLYIG